MSTHQGQTTGTGTVRFGTYKGRKENVLMNGGKECLIVQGIQPEIKPMYKQVELRKRSFLFPVMIACWLLLHMHFLSHSVHKMNRNQDHTNDRSTWHHRCDLQRTSEEHGNTCQYTLSLREGKQ